MTVKKNLPKGLRFANGVFLGGALLCLLIFIYALLKNGIYPFKLYFATIIGTVLFLAALRLNKDLKINIATGLISVTFLFYLMEISLFLWEPAPWEKHIARKKAAEKAGVPYDNRTKWQVFKDLRHKGIDAFPIVFPHYFLPDGLMSQKGTFFIMSSVSEATTILCNETGEYVIYISDEFGFNNPPDSWTAKQPDVMLVGDSFVHGGCVKQGDDMAGQLRRSGWEALNVGMSGNGPLLDLATLKEYVEPMKPETVLWVYYEDNDLVDFQKEKNSAFLMQYLQKDFSQDLMHRQKEIDLVLQQYIENEFRKYKPGNTMLDLLRLKHIRFRFKQFKFSSDSKTPVFPKPDRLFREVLLQARDRVSAWGGDLYFVYLPQWSRYTKNIDHDQWRHRKEVLSIVEDLGIPVIDLHEEVLLRHEDLRSLLPLRLYGHYNAEGYKLFAEAINRHLQRK